MAIQERIGILTGGGDCPGLNAAIRAAAKYAINQGYEVIGFHNGWSGMIDEDYEILDRPRTSGIIDRGGTILCTSRISPLEVDGGTDKVFATYKKLGLSGLVVLGGEGTLTVSSILFEKGLPVVGIPKTIDNDVRGTDYTIGFQTAVEIATQALDRLRTTAESHHRVMLLEVMGRNAGWIAVYAGMSNGADAILIPEIPLDNEKVEDLCQGLLRRKARGANFSIIAVAEGTILQGNIVARDFVTAPGQKPRPRLGGVAAELAEIIREKTRFEVGVSSLGYIQRGGTPVAYDRSLATFFGVKAVSLVCRGRFGRMAALRGNRIVSVPLSEVATGIKQVDMGAYRCAKRFFG
jgi:6-phosphofructokinase 1